MPGIAGTRILSESELIPAIATSSASSRHGVRFASPCDELGVAGSGNRRPVRSLGPERPGCRAQPGATLSLDQRSQRGLHPRVLLIALGDFLLTMQSRVLVVPV